MSDTPSRVDQDALDSVVLSAMKIPKLREIEYSYIDSVIRQTPTRKEAAKKLGISVRGLQYKVAEMRAAGYDVPPAVKE